MTITYIKNWENINFDEIIDVRSPSEFKLDHIPTSINMPVLNDNQRALIGKIYKKENAFYAKKIGATLFSKNIFSIFNISYSHYIIFIFLFKLFTLPINE